MQEIWKDIEGYNDLYQVSNLGRIKSLKRHRETILKPGKVAGYYTVCLSKNNNQKNFFIHRLVAKAFVSNPSNLPCINHKDENKLNNCIDNLEWCTYKYNNNYGTHKQRVGQKHWKKVNQYDLEGNFIKEWDSLISIEKELNYDHRNISACCKHKYGRPTAYGYKWEYK